MLLKYCYIYLFGGIYVDIKYESVNNFRFIDLIDKEYVVREPLGVQSCLLIFLANNKLMFNCIELIKHNTLNGYRGYSPLLTGPLLLSKEYLKQCFNINNTELRWAMVEHRQHIYKNDVSILIQYPEYRTDLENKSDQPHYTTMYWNDDIYN